jgi:hypothetical protein
MGKMLRGVRQVARDTGSAVGIVHHYGKPDELKSGADLLRGASAIRDVCADIISVTPTRKGERRVGFPKVRHQKAPPPFFVTIEGEDGGRVRIGFGEHAQETGFENAGLVIQAVRDEGNRITRQTLLGILKQRNGWSENTAQKYIDEALSSQLLTKNKVGKEVYYEAT